MNEQTKQGLQDLWSKMSDATMLSIWKDSGPYIWDVEYAWSLDLMHLGFPFLY
jgi:hypothetical protein